MTRQAFEDHPNLADAIKDIAERSLTPQNWSALLDAINGVCATHATQADTIERLQREYAEVAARLEAQHAELAALRGATTDEALVEVAIDAFTQAMSPDTREQWCMDDSSHVACMRPWFRAAIAKVGPAIVAAERERCAKIGDARSETLLNARDKQRAHDPRMRLESCATEARLIAAAIRAGATDAR
jgi:hypothetical protein